MIFIDIDGTLTDHGQQGGNALPNRIEKVKRLIAKGKEVILWSGGGSAYVKWFAEKHDIKGAAAYISKPHIMVDDNPNLRPPGSIILVEPSHFFDDAPITNVP